jgi:hypothetical protein
MESFNGVTLDYVNIQEAPHNKSPQPTADVDG